MSKFRRQTWVLVLLALLALFAGCKGESSPTAPPVTSTGTGSGVPTTTGGTPTGAAVTLSTSNANPVVGSSSVITATVTVNGQPAPDGTAVEFSTDIGSFCLVVTGCAEPTTNPVRAALRTTVAGKTTIVLTSASAATATVQAVVNNIIQKTTVRFSTAPVDPPLPDVTPAITTISPTIARPAGGETIVISGRNFVAPVRVLFSTAAGVTKEGQVISVTANEIRVLSPGFDVGTTQQLAVTITVINAAGSTSESRVTNATATLTYQSTVLTPKITTASPASGPINGGTRVTLFGEGFQFPIQVFFGAAEAQVISTTFNQVVVLSPAGSATADQGSGAVTGFVDVRVVNINSATTTTASNLFRYTPKMQVTLVGPTEGPYTGGTDVQINGVGFDDPLSVTLAGIAAQVIRVSGTQLLVRSSGVQPPSCADVVGPIVVTNGDNGDFANGPAWTYRVRKPFIAGVIAASGGSIVPGSSLNVTILNPGGLPIIKLGTAQVGISGATANPDGTTTYSVAVPTTITLNTETCTAGGSRPIATAFDVTYTSAETGCTVTATGGLTVNPVTTAKLLLTPNPLVLTARAATPGSAGPPVVAPTPASNGNGIFTVVNNSTNPVTITSVVSNNPQFVVPPPGSAPNGTVLLPCESVAVPVTYISQAAGQSSQGQITVSATSTVPGGPSTTSVELVTGNTQ